jgi:Uma2 family endonuclease
MATTTQISLETYLTTSYEPDCDYVDGVLEERNVGEFDHNMVQRAILFWFYLHEREWRIRSIQEQRTKVASTKVRIPDVCVFSRDVPIEQVFTKPQLIAVEVLSPEDRHSRVDARLKNFRELRGAEPVGCGPGDAHWLGLQRWELGAQGTV